MYSHPDLQLWSIPATGHARFPAHTPVPENGPRVGPRMCVTCSALPQHLASASVQLRKGPGESRLPGLEFLQWLDSPLKIVVW